MAPISDSGSLVGFQQLFESLPTAYLVMNADLVVIAANNSYLNLLGRKREDLVGRYVFDVFPPTDESLDEEGRNPVEVSFKKARDTQQPDPMPVQKYDVIDPSTGRMVERFWSLISAPVLSDSGETLFVLQRVEDVTDFVNERKSRQAELERGQDWQRRFETAEADLYVRAQELRVAQAAKDVTAQQLASLAEVALSLTAAKTIEDLEKIVVGRGLSVLGADGGGIISPHEEWGWRATLSDTLGQDVQLNYGHVPYDSPLPAPYVARTGERLLLPTVASGLAFDKVSMSGVYKDIGRMGWAFLPLIVDEACLGCLAVSWTDEHSFNAAEISLLDGFAAQCAQALERLHSAEAQRRSALAAQRMSETLQRSLLTKPPTPDALRIAVRYQPASQQAQVGGDWYDAFLNSSGSTTVVVGDVSGHDRIAAATMGQFRNLLRGIAYDSNDSPSMLLTRLDAALKGLEIDSLATAVLGRIGHMTDDTWNFDWSNAGHLPPLLRQPDGSVEILDGTNDLLLGLDAESQRSNRSIVLREGSTLLLFTDGLIERRNSNLDNGIERLLDILSKEGSRDPESLCDQLLTSLGRDSNDDDIALLVLQVYGHTVPRITETLVVHASPRAVRDARQLMQRLCQQLGVADELADTSVLLISEVVTNAVMHAQSEARVSITVSAHEVYVEVADDATKMPVAQPRNDTAVSGRGVGMLDVAASEWGVRSDVVGKTVWFTVTSSTTD